MKLSDAQMAEIKGHFTKGVPECLGTLTFKKDAEALLSSHEALTRRVKELDGALREIARQHLEDEMDLHEIDAADWRGGYEACVKTARKALEKTSRDAKGGNQ